MTNGYLRFHAQPDFVSSPLRARSSSSNSVIAASLLLRISESGERAWVSGLRSLSVLAPCAAAIPICIACCLLLLLCALLAI
jgi:hypothetical protein